LGVRYSLREELKFQATELVTIQSRLNDSHLAHSDLATTHAPLQLELAKCQREKDFLDQQLVAVQQELFRKSDEERQLRSETTQRLFQLESQHREMQLNLEEKERHAQLLQVRV
jgi:hypothetical protein